MEIVEEKELVNILTLLYRKTGYDFREYRKSTLGRRVARRLHATGCRTEALYLDYLKNHPEECALLLKDLTIHVTEFFREPDAFKALEEKVFSEWRENSQVFIWSAGCATGEEAYSLAIALDQFFPTVNTNYQILATDLDDDSLNRGSQGIYIGEKIKSLSASVRENYFHPKDEGYQIIPRIKERVNFHAVDLINEKMNQRFDLISCRNVLIYFSKELQEKALLNFHKALKPNGFLWLGKAESLWGKPQELFETVDKGAKIFRKKGVEHEL